MSERILEGRPPCPPQNCCSRPAQSGRLPFNTATERCGYNSLFRRFGRFFFSALPLERHFFFRGNLVLRFGRAEEPVVEPTDNILQTLDAMPRLAGARELVRFVREPHHHRRNFPKLERTEH